MLEMRPRRLRRWPGSSRLLLITVGLVAACTALPPGSPTAAPASSAPAVAQSAWGSELANLEPDGRRSRESALALFALAFGPLPGVPSGPAETGSIGSASPAVRAVRAAWDELTDEQRDAIDERLAPAPDSTLIEIPRTSSAVTAGLPGAAAISRTAQEPVDPFERDLQQIGRQARQAAARYFGEMPDLPNGKSALTIRQLNAPNEPFVSFFNPISGPGGVEQCEIFVNARSGLGLRDIGRPLTLDVVHCFQSWRMGTEQGFDGSVPAWAWEGPAEYIMLEAWPTQEDDALYWATYLLLPDVPLFERSYDAVGYWAQAWEAGVDLSDAFVAVLSDVDNPERFALAGTATSAFLDKWASEQVRWSRGDWGPDWGFLGPGMSTTRMHAPEQPMSVGVGSLEAFSQEAYTNHLFAVGVTADIVQIAASGRARIGDGTRDEVIRGSVAFCVTDRGCGPCPDGSQPSIAVTPLASASVLAVSGGTDGTSGSVSGHALEEFCQPTPSPTDDAFCIRYREYVAWASSAGDEITREAATEIERRFIDMQPYAPGHLVEYVDLMILIYGTFARAPDPIQVPLTGQLPLHRIPEALSAMHGHCGIPLPLGFTHPET